MSPGDDELQANVRQVLLGDLKKVARAFQNLKGGRNSRVYRVDCDDGSVFAAKAYFYSAQDRRDRMGCEFRALQFLKSEGLRGVPVPFAMDLARRVAIYEFVEGRTPSADQLSVAEIDQSVGFLGALRHFATSGRASGLPAASEACFSIEAIFRSLDDRFSRLNLAAEQKPDLADFLRDDLMPFRELARGWCRAFCADHGIAPDVEVAMGERTLSPSDFGFHNTLRKADGRLAFLDFEYFGWDDPAKTIADFLLHPAMELSDALKMRFFSQIIEVFPGVPKLRDRLRAVYPLFGLKWCAILLNEFTLVHLARRRFADDTQGAWNEAAQLEKARRMLAQIVNEHHNFPYHA